MQSWRAKKGEKYTLRRFYSSLILEAASSEH
jgi:hypothetical protein